MALTTVSRLQSKAVKDSTFIAYSSAVQRFVEWIQSHYPSFDDFLQLDCLLCTYADVLYDENPRRGQRQLMVNTLCGVQFFRPETRRSLPRASLALKGWDKLVPSRSPPPIPLAILEAICGYLYSRSMPNFSIAFILCFHGLLRAQELLATRFGDIALPGDARLNSLHRSARAGLLVRDAKTGSNQFVPLSDEGTLSRIQSWSQAKRLCPTDELFSMSYYQLSKAFDTALAHLGISSLGFTLHSIRHGGATSAFLQGAQFAEVMELGRWASKASCRRYLNAGKGLLLTLSIPAVARRRIRRYSRLWSTASFGRCGVGDL